VSYTITAFPSARLTEGTQEEKGRVGPLATIGEPRTFSTFAEVVNAAATGTVSFHQFTASDKCASHQVHRQRAYFASTNLVALDIDGGTTIDEATAILRQNKLKFGIYTSFNHSMEVQKFRIVIETSEPITEEATFRATWESLKLILPNIDPSCKDTARLFYHSNPANKQVIIEEAGGLVPVVRETPQTVSVRKPSSAPNIDDEGFESANQRRPLPQEVRTWLSGLNEYGEPWTPSEGERSNLFYKYVRLCKEREYTAEWCDEHLGRRLRTDLSYVKKYGGPQGVDEKIRATVEQAYREDSRHDSPDLYSYKDLCDARAFIKKWMGARGATVKKNGELIYSDGGQPQTPRQALDMILLDYNTARTSLLTKQADMPKEERRRIPKHDTRLLTAALNEYVEKQRGQFLVKLREKLQHTPDSSPSELKKFVRGIRGKEDPVVEAVLEHFVWQVKRKIFGLEVQYHLMPILTGIQGNGKSTAVKKLYAPLLDFVATPTLTELTDKRFFESHKYNFIAFCDEMQNADKTDVEALKNFITADRQTARELYSTTMVEFKQNCTAIGCSNKSLATLIYDPTGMRRFFEIPTDPEMKANGGWALLGEVDFEKLWRQVDENIPAERCPYLAKADEIKAAQELLRTPDPVEAFLDLTEATVTDPLKTTFVKKSDFYASYKQFCFRNGHKPKDANWFGRAMSDKGYRDSRISRDGKSERVWEVSSSYQAPIE
jgi:hypothetical protein